MSLLDLAQQQELRDSFALVVSERDQALERCARLFDELEQLNSLIDSNNDDYENIIERYDSMRLELKVEQDLVASTSRRNDGLNRELNDALAENNRLVSEFADKCREFEAIREKNEHLIKNSNSNFDDDQAAMKFEFEQKCKENEILREQLLQISRQKSGAFENLDAKYRRLVEVIVRFRNANLLKTNQILPLVKVENEQLSASSVQEGVASADTLTRLNLTSDHQRLLKLCATLTRDNKRLSSELVEKQTELNANEKKIKKYKRRCDDFESETKTLKKKLHRLKSDDDTSKDYVQEELKRIQNILYEMNRQISTATDDDDLPTRRQTSSRRRSPSSSSRRKRSEPSLSHSSTDDEDRESWSTSGSSANTSSKDDRKQNAVGGAPSSTFREPIKFQLKNNLSKRA